MTASSCTVAEPQGHIGSCFWALAVHGRPASTAEVRRWLWRDGEDLGLDQVRGNLEYLANVRVVPLVRAVGVPGSGGAPVWELTDAGGTLLAED